MKQYDRHLKPVTTTTGQALMHNFAIQNRLEYLSYLLRYFNRATRAHRFVHLYCVVHVHEVAMVDAKRFQILRLGEHKAQVTPGVAREGVIC